MSGHSKWSTIKHKKAVKDAQRANAFSRLIKDVTIAAREGGDPEANFKLRLAIDKAKTANVPQQNIERAIERGSGAGKDGAQMEEVVYEAYGPGQVAMLIKTVTDNTNRTLSEIKNILKKGGGKLAGEGSVSWQFEKVGIIRAGQKTSPGVDQKAGQGVLTAEALEEIIIESEAKDYRRINEGGADDGYYQIFTLPAELQKVGNSLKEKGVEVEAAELGYFPQNPLVLDATAAIDYQNLLGSFDENEDVVEIYDNVAAG